jgi:hypothetical protein
MAPHTERLKWAESGRYASSAENAASRSTLPFSRWPLRL